MPGQMPLERSAAASGVQPFHLLHGLMSAGKLGEPAFAALWRATAAACQAQTGQFAAEEEGEEEEVVEEEELEGGSTRVVCPPWSDAEKKALMRHLGQLEAFPGYPFSHGKNGKKAKSPLVPQHMASWNAICAAVAAECGAALRTVAATYVVAQGLRSGRFVGAWRRR